ncbi:hypothetical protein HMPREF9962_1112 [Streptococcus parasanguinis SK236]|nr:hypothetical protein HMPREF9962_1112 [Streptococcus parasanguinis SK236]
MNIGIVTPFDFLIKKKATSSKGRRNVVPPSFMFLKKEGHL